MNLDYSAALESQQSIRNAFEQLGVRDTDRALQNWEAIARSGIPSELLDVLWSRCHESLPKIADPDLGLHGVAQFVAVARSPLAVASLIEREPEALLKLLQLTNAGESLSRILRDDPESLDLLRLTDGRPVDRQTLSKELVSDVELLTDRGAIRDSLCRHKNREFLRIAYGDIVGQQPTSIVAEQLTFVADAVCEAAFLAAEKSCITRFGRPMRTDGSPSRRTILGFGKLAGREQSYSAQIDLVFLYDANGKTDGERSITSSEFTVRLADQFAALLGAVADVDNDQLVYRIGSQLWTDGPVKKTSHFVAVVDRDELVQYLETQGRTWHRQLLLKARTIAGDKPFGDEFLQDMEPWVFQRYLTRADIAELKALKRRIEKRSHRSGADDRNVVSGRGGMLDVEFVIQFLQLLNGGDAVEIREANTLLAIEQLAAMACINSDERQILADGYEFLCRIRRRLQISFGSETDSLPVGQAEFDLLARHLDYTGDSTALRDDYLQRTGLIRRVLDHLLHDAFDDGTESAPEIDLMLDPNPSVEQIENALSPYGFTNPSGAYDRLVDLATERIRFLSTRRCRTFLAAIAPSLLDVIGKTPVPDETLTNLCRVSDSLGGKGVLWELFSYSPPTLDLYVRLCACSRYLSDMLTSNPGMLDDLMDSLVQNKLPSAGQLQLRLDELCRGADDVDPILHSFKNSQHLTAGVRDILGKDDITDTMAFLSDVAEVCLRQIANHQYQLLVRKYGQPTTEAGTQCEYAIFGLGKLGGREPNYHSNFDIVLVYESNGVTEVHQTQKDRNKAVSTQNHHFFHELAQKVVQQSNRVGPLGRLFEVAVDRHVGGTSGAMAITLLDFERQFLTENVVISAWQSLCRIRPILGIERFRQNVIGVITQLLIGHVPSQPLAQQIYQSRMKLEENASELNLKRAAGGTLDVEFVVQSIQLQHAAVDASVLATGTVDGLERLEEHGLMASDDAEYLAESYRFLRGVEARLRLMNTGARHDLPTDDDQLKRLALLLSMDSGDSLRGECLGRMRGVRERFLKYVPEVSSE